MNVCISIYTYKTGIFIFFLLLMIINGIEHKENKMIIS